MRKLQRVARNLAISVTAALLAGGAHGDDTAVHASPHDVEPLQPGAHVPTVAVETVQGELVDLAELVHGGALLVFYRGGWCPYCNTQLGELRKIETELSELGFPVIAISPDRPRKLTKSLEVKDLGYSLYSDSMLTAARAFGIAYRLTDEEFAKYAQYGIDLENASGQKHHQLPVPSVFLVEAGGTIRWTHSDPDYRVRPDNAVLLEAARLSHAGTATP